VGKLLLKSQNGTIQQQQTRFMVGQPWWTGIRNIDDSHASLITPVFTVLSHQHPLESGL